MNVLIVDDHQIILDGLKSLFVDIEGVNVLGYLDTAEKALLNLKNFDVDILITDIEMPNKNGIWLIKKIKEEKIKVKILVLTMHNEKLFVEELFRLGVDGYLLKTTTHEELKIALNNVYNGKKQFSSEVTEVFLDNNKKSTEIELTKRELEVLNLVADGLSTNEIAEKLFLSSKTIDKYRASLLLKADVKNVAGLIRYAFTNNWIK